MIHNSHDDYPPPGTGRGKPVPTPPQVIIKSFSSMASKPIDILRIRTGSQQKKLEKGDIPN